MSYLGESFQAPAPRKSAEEVTAQRTAAVLVGHPAYAHMLPTAIRSLEAQNPKFNRKVLVFDAGRSRKEPKIDLPTGWSLIVGHWENPNAARNAGLAQVRDCDWICFWDADNEMAPDHVKLSLPILNSVPKDVGICYPEVQKVTEGKIWHRRNHPEWTLHDGLRTSLCDTSSFWRRQALDEVGGFSPEQCQHDDYELALRMYRAGWKGKKLPVTLHHHFHGENRSRRVTPEDEEKVTRSLYTAWSFGFVTLWGPKKASSLKVLKWLETADIPPRSALYWVDNSGGTMTKLLQKWSVKLAGRFGSITIVNAGDPHRTEPGESYLNAVRHQQVARLYNNVFGRVAEEMVVTLEDDTLPPQDGVYRLLELIRPFSEVAVAASVYRSRNAPRRLCAAVCKEAWIEVPNFDDLPDKPFEVGMTGGGFAIIANWALKQAMPMRCEFSETGALMGWDGNLGIALSGLGYKLMVHPEVKSEHLCPEVTAYLRKLRSAAERPTRARRSKLATAA